MPEAFAQLGAAYQQGRPIPTDWPRQNPVSWADTPDPATGMTPRQLGQGVIGAGKEIPQLMRAALPQADTLDPTTGQPVQTRNPLADTALGRVLNRYIFDPMTIRGPEQQTGAKMMDIATLLHGFNPVGMEETGLSAAQEQELAHEWVTNAFKRGANLEQARLNRLRRGGPKADRLIADWLAKQERIQRMRSSPQVGYQALGTEEAPAGVIGEPTPEQAIRERYQGMLLRGEIPPGYASEPYKILRSSLTDKYVVHSNFDNRFLGEFETKGEAQRFVDRIMPTPPEGTIRWGEEGPYPPGSIGAEAQRPSLTPSKQPRNPENFPQIENYKDYREHVFDQMRKILGKGEDYAIVDPDTGQWYDTIEKWGMENPGKDWRSAILPLLPSGQPMSMEERLKSLISDLARQEPTPEQMKAFQKWLDQFNTEADRILGDMPPAEWKPRDIQSWKWPYDVSPVSRDHRGLMRKPLLPWEGGDIVDFYTEGHGGGGGGGNGH